MLDDDDVPQLSAETFLALQEFYKEQEQRESELMNRINSSDTDLTFEENWQLSQFWYDDVTVKTLVDIAKKSVGADGKIALISCPTLYKPIRNDIELNCEVHLYEFDERFTIYGTDFVQYDYNFPLNVSDDRKSYYDLVIADPPFLSDECLIKSAATIKFLTKEKIILCTGSVMEDLAKRTLKLHRCKFQPRHKNNLANEFSCFSNFDIDVLL